MYQTLLLCGDSHRFAYLKLPFIHEETEAMVTSVGLGLEQHGSSLPSQKLPLC